MQFNKVAVACALPFILSSTVVAAKEISGVVLSSSGKAISQAKISLPNSSISVMSDKTGRFVLTNLTPGEVELHITAPNFSHANEHVVVKQEGTVTISIKLSPTVMEIVDVYATPLHSSTIESALPVNVITSDELRLKQSSTLGETLKNEVGVHSTYFGPVASSPIIRGMDGPRVMITQNGLDAGDASRVGPDHVVSSETSTAKQIEVLRGPSTLFYGSGAIGGVVNVVDNRVPTSLDKSFDYMLKHNDVASEDEASFSLNTHSEKLAFHVDGFWRESDDYKIPGYAESESTHDEDEHDEHDEHDERGEKGTLLNSASKSSGFTLGTSYVVDNGFVGFSFGRMTREYGIPGHSHGSHEDEHEEEHHDEHEEEHDENVYGDLEQDRIQFLSELTFDKGFINKVASKASYTDYQHKEIEGGAVGTIFNNEMVETRFDIFHQEYAGWKGAWTFHYKSTDFEAVGLEAFTPPSDTTSYAFAWLEEQHLSNNLLLQVGARVERVVIEAGDRGLEFHDEHEEDHDEHGDEHDEHEEELFFDKQSFTPVSLSAGLIWDYQKGYNLGFSLSYSQRAPSAAELFSNGAHIGTNSYEVGALYEIHEEGDEVHFDLTDKDVELETATNIDITWRKFEGNFGFVVGAFYNQVDDYLYQEETGLYADDGHGHDEEHEEHEEEGLPVYIYQQHDVKMYGVEAEFIYQWNDMIKTSIFTDYIRAELDGGDNLPRIPPMRLGGQLDYVSNNYSAQFSVTHYFDQEDIAERESETDGYTMIDANFNYYLDGIGEDFVIFVKANNLTDEDARVHQSFLKDVAPLPARGFEFGIRGSF
jgi:iron complex outermembrane receptor protein